MSFKQRKNFNIKLHSRIFLLGLMTLSFFQAEMAKAQSGFEYCDEINQNQYQTEYRAGSAGVDCVECLFSQQKESNPWLEGLSIVAGPLAYFGSAYVGAKYQYKSQKAWASAYESGYNACTSQFNSALDYNISSGATSYTADEMSGLMGSCNGNGLGMYAGYGGLVGNGYGGFGNPYLSAGYSGGFMGGMMGPSFGMGGMGNGMGIGITGGIGLGGLGGLGMGGLGGGFGIGGGMGMGYPGMGMGGMGMGYGMGNGMGIGGGIGLGIGGLGGLGGMGMGYPGVGGGIGIRGGIGIGGGMGMGYPGMGGGGLGIYGRSPYIGLGGGVNVGIGGNGGWGYSGGVGMPGMTGMYGLPGVGLGGSGMINGNMGLGNGYINGMYGNGMGGSWNPSGSYYGNTGGNNQYWQQQQQAQMQAYGRTAAQSSVFNRINQGNYETAASASGALYNNYMKAGQAYQNNLGGSYGAYGAGLGGYYGGTPYAAGNIGANFRIGGYAGFGF